MGDVENCTNIVEVECVVKGLESHKVYNLSVSVYNGEGSRDDQKEATIVSGTIRTLASSEPMLLLENLSCRRRTSRCINILSEKQLTYFWSNSIIRSLCVRCLLLKFSIHCRQSVRPSVTSIPQKLIIGFI